MEENNIEIEIDESVKKLIFEKGFDKNYGARPLRRAIQNYVEDAISEKILEGELNRSKNLIVQVDENNNILVK